MNFFEHQEAARRNSRRLVVLFALAVIAIVIAVNVAATVLFQMFAAPVGLRWQSGSLPNGFYFTNTVVVLGLIFGGTLLEMNRLKAGGVAVAQMVGAREVDTSTRDLLDRRLVNIVEEMAIASGVPMPRVFVMDAETSINAFAAGHSIDDAIVAVTRGTLTRLSRDELQGVIAHEFSHILNGDMRLNLRLIGVLYGLLIVALAGRFLLELGGRSRGGGDRSSGSAIAVLVAAGLALWVLGYIGVFFGRLIKAGVSRQREFLADASAVQFTRNPDGIGGALRKIAGLGVSCVAFSRPIRRWTNGCVASMAGPSAPCRRPRTPWRSPSAVSNRRRSRHGARRSSMCRQPAWQRWHSLPKRFLIARARSRA
jgi:Zn-dependent protease with chaperone function